MKSIQSATILKLLSLAMVLSTFLLRPSALGQGYTTPGLALVVALTILVLALLAHGRSARFKPTGLPRHFRFVLVVTLIYWTYETLLIVVLAESNVDFFAKEVVSLVVVFATYGWLLTNRNFNEMFFGQFCGVIALLGWSSVITIALAAFTGLDSLHVFNVDVKGYGDADDSLLAVGAVYFPFSMLYTRFTTDSIDLFRFSHFYREAGIAQAFCCFCLAYEAFTKNRRWVLLGSAAGAITAFSTIGTAVLMFTAVCVYLARKRGRITRKMFFVPVLAAAGVLLVLYAPGIGLADKGVTHFASIDDRNYGMARSLEKAFENPFGTGPFSGESNGVTSGINLIASLASLGFFGVLMQLLLMSGWSFALDRASVQRVVCCLPVLITALTSQPLVGAPMVYLIALCVISREAVAGQGAPMLLKSFRGRKFVFRRQT